MAKKKKIAPRESRQSRLEDFLGSQPCRLGVAALVRIGPSFSRSRAAQTLVGEGAVSGPREAADCLKRLEQAGLLQARGSQLALTAQVFSERKKGVINFSRNSLGYFYPEDGSERLALCEETGEALPGDVVWARIEWDRAVAEALLKRRRTWVCRYRRTRSGGYCEPFDNYGASILVAGAEAPKGRNGRNGAAKASKCPYEDGDVVEVELTDASCRLDAMDRVPEGVIRRLIARRDDARAEVLATAERLGIPREFSRQALEEAGALPDAVDSDLELASRVDLRDIGFVTIDGEDARDFDDAVWCERFGEDSWRLLVAIADVSRYVTPESPLDVDAQKRATSVYFPQFVIPMLPEKLSNGLCSLNPGVDRCTMVCDMVVGADGRVRAYQFYPALIHSKARLTYTCVQEALNGNAAELLERGGSLEDIFCLHALYKAFAAARRERGAISFSSTETRIVLSPDARKVEKIVPAEHTDAHRLIEECMLAANTCAADFLLRHKATCLMRVHDKPSPDKLAGVRRTLSAYGLKLSGGDSPTAKDYDAVLEAVAGKPWAGAIQLALLCSMQQAQYSPDNIGHYGLHYEAYTHFTSPIRRYPDLLVHRAIRAILLRHRYLPRILVDETEARESRTGMRMIEAQREHDAAASVNAPRKGSALDRWRRLGVLCSAAERRAEQASRDIEAWYKACFMTRFVGESFTGVITAVMPAGLIVSLPELFVEGFVHISEIAGEYIQYDEARNTLVGRVSGRRYRIGDSLKVRVLEAQPETRSITFAAVNGRSSRR